MENFTSQQLLDIIVSLDNEVQGCSDITRAERLRSLKWKVFAILVDVQAAERKAA